MSKFNIGDEVIVVSKRNTKYNNQYGIVDKIGRSDRVWVVLPALNKRMNLHVDRIAPYEYGKKDVKRMNQFEYQDEVVVIAPRLKTTGETASVARTTSDGYVIVMFKDGSRGRYLPESLMKKEHQKSDESPKKQSRKLLPVVVVAWGAAEEYCRSVLEEIHNPHKDFDECTIFFVEKYEDVFDHEVIINVMDTNDAVAVYYPLEDTGAVLVNKVVPVEVVLK